MGQRTGVKCVLWLGALAAALLWVPAPVLAQDVFFTQSGGRGLQNAKMNARVSKVETDTKDLQAEMAKIQPFAKKPIISCANTGDKLRWVGNDWACDTETDPTVQAFAKKALPTCGAGQILSASGSEFNCANSGFLSAETDPTVQGFAKAPLPNCNTGQVLSASGDNLTCIADERGLTKEEDPFVHSFARTDVASIQNCEVGKVLTMTGNRLECVFDAVGITVETDPTVQHFAKNDIPGYTLAACAAGEVLTAGVHATGQVVLQCADGNAVVGPIISATKLGDLQDVNAPNPQNDDVLRYDGSRWVNSDDKIGNLTNNRWCHFTATEIVCDRAIPAPMPAAACNATDMVQWNGTAWSCADIGSTVGGAITLGQLSDVTITAPVVGQGLTYTGTGWANGYSDRILRYDTRMLVHDVNGAGSYAQIVVDGTGWLTATPNGVGIGTNNPSALLDVPGTISASSLRFANWISGPIVQATQYVSAGSIHTSGTVMVSNTVYADNIRTMGDVYVGGALYVSGAQSIDGVVFANGGVSATGAISATAFYGDGSQLTGIGSGDRILSGTTFVQATDSASVTFVTDGQQRMILGANGRLGYGTLTPQTEVEVYGTVSATNLHLSGNLTVSGSQTIDGVIFANGGVSATGAISATNFYGDGSGLTNVTASSMDWYGLLRIPTQVVAVSDGTSIQMVGVSATNVSVTSNLTASQIAAGTGLFTSVAANSGSFGNVNVTGYVSAGTVHTSGTVRVSNTVYADNIRAVGDVYVGGSLFVSGSQSIDGVIFANGGVSATGGISATYFSGDGSRLTGLPAGDRIVSGTTRVLASENSSVTIRTNSADRMVVGQNGFVGIGTVNPLSTLHLIQAAFADRAALSIQSAAAPALSLYNGTNGWAMLMDTTGGVNKLKFGYGGATISSGAVRMTVEAGGNVGIGTEDPQARLDVSGTLKVAGTGAEGCGATAYGSIRLNPATGALQVCRQ